MKYILIKANMKKGGILIIGFCLFLTSCGFSNNDTIIDIDNSVENNANIIKEEKNDFIETNSTEKIIKKKIITSVNFLENWENIEPIGIIEKEVSKSTKRYAYVQGDETYEKLGMVTTKNGENYDFLLLKIVPYRFMGVDNLYFLRNGKNLFYIQGLSNSWIFGDHFIKDKSTDEKMKLAFSNSVEFAEDYFDLDILLNKYIYPENIKFSKNNKEYNLKLFRKLHKKYDIENLTKLSDISRQTGYNLYIENKNADWGDLKYKEFKNTSFYDKNEKYSKEELKELSIIDDDYGILQSDGIFLQLEDNSLVLYTLDIPFLTERNITTFESNHYYAYGDGSSCGVRNNSFAYDVSTYQLPIGERYVSETKIREEGLSWEDAGKQSHSLVLDFSEKDIKLLENTTENEKIYTFTKQSQILQDMYKYLYTTTVNINGCLSDPDMMKNDIDCQNIKYLSYEEYAQDKQVLLWNDPLGRKQLVISYATASPSACGAKPVIYLYPEKKQTVDVRLNWEPKNLISIPLYTGNWKVTAKPDGELYHLDTDKDYEYLFWEDILNYTFPKDGFVVKRENIDEFLTEKLSFIGMNEKEMGDFKEFWVPNMQDSKYYFINFIQTKDFNKIAPISVSPKPDSMMRVFMHLEKLDKKKSVKKQNLTHFDRKGFSVIEWGGRLID